ncbi:hypothetical protein Bbelb_335270 [Branchiostoma belcheri]|nr:hypothetical protein Bbelb_335270 [Branchiostoma belcheri]
MDDWNTQWRSQRLLMRAGSSSSKAVPQVSVCSMLPCVSGRIACKDTISEGTMQLMRAPTEASRETRGTSDAEAASAGESFPGSPMSRGTSVAPVTACSVYGPSKLRCWCTQPSQKRHELDSSPLSTTVGMRPTQKLTAGSDGTLKCVKNPQEHSGLIQITCMLGKYTLELSLSRRHSRAVGNSDFVLHKGYDGVRRTWGY